MGGEIGPKTKRFICFKTLYDKGKFRMCYDTCHVSMAVVPPHSSAKIAITVTVTFTRTICLIRYVPAVLNNEHFFPSIFAMLLCKDYHSVSMADRKGLPLPKHVSYFPHHVISGPPKMTKLNLSTNYYSFWFLSFSWYFIFLFFDY